MISRFLMVFIILAISVGSAQADPKDGHKEMNKKNWEREKEREKKEHERLREMEKNRMEHEFEMDKKELEHHREMDKKRAEHEREMSRKRMEMEREEWKEGGWARKCGLPPGLAKQGKIPPGWEKKCRSGHKYYEHEDEFRGEVYKTPGELERIDVNSPSYQTVYAMDEAACKVKALKSAGNIVEGVAIGAVYGGLIGAAGGAVIEAVRKDGNVKQGVIAGAAGGAAGGAILGGVLSSNDYKSDYLRCMKHRGHSVK